MSDAAASATYWARVRGSAPPSPLVVPSGEDEDEACLDEARLEYAPPSSVLRSLCRLAWDATSGLVGEVVSEPSTLLL
jgi:hypothetical protein